MITGVLISQELMNARRIMKRQCDCFVTALVESDSTKEQFSACDVALGAALQYIDMLETIVFIVCEQTET